VYSKFVIIRRTDTNNENRCKHNICNGKKCAWFCTQYLIANGIRVFGPSQRKWLMQARSTSFWSLLVFVVGRRSIPKTWRSLGGWSERRFRLRGNRSRRRSTWLRLGHRRHRCKRTSLRSLGRRFRFRRSSRIRQPVRRYRSRFRIWNAHKCISFIQTT